MPNTGECSDRYGVRDERLQRTHNSREVRVIHTGICHGQISDSALIEENLILTDDSIAVYG